MTEIIKCSNCGAQLDRGVNYCEHCGAAIQWPDTGRGLAAQPIIININASPGWGSHPEGIGEPQHGGGTPPIDPQYSMCSEGYQRPPEWHRDVPPVPQSRVVWTGQQDGGAGVVEPLDTNQEANRRYDAIYGKRKGTGNTAGTVVGIIVVVVIVYVLFTVCSVLCVLVETQ